MASKHSETQRHEHPIATRLRSIDDQTPTIRDLIIMAGDDPDRDGMRDTPGRVQRAIVEMTLGYADDPKSILSKTFDVQHDELVVLKGIQFVSLCEHHLLPFIGTAAIGYLPGKRVVGISKLARLVACFARRFQIQERMTSQIAESIERHLKAKGVGVVIEAHHACMGCRGVRQSNTIMTTSAMLGRLRSNASARAEFLALLN